MECIPISMTMFQLISDKGNKNSKLDCIHCGKAIEADDLEQKPMAMSIVEDWDKYVMNYHRGCV